MNDVAVRERECTVCPVWRGLPVAMLRCAHFGDAVACLYRYLDDALGQWWRVCGPGEHDRKGCEPVDFINDRAAAEAEFARRERILLGRDE